jgi:hypothetical protein
MQAVTDYWLKGWLLFGFTLCAPLLTAAEYFGRPNERR